MRRVLIDVGSVNLGMKGDEEPTHRPSEREPWYEGR